MAKRKLEEGNQNKPKKATNDGNNNSSSKSSQKPEITPKGSGNTSK